MFHSNVPQTSSNRMHTTSAGWGVIYKVALIVIAVGVLAIVFSPFVGGLLHTLAIMPLMELWGVTGYRDEPETGVEFLALLGSCYLVVGICMFLIRLVVDLLGLAGGPVLTRWMTPRSKLALGTAAAGAVIFATGMFPMTLISLLFVDYESAVIGITSSLRAILLAGVLLIACSVITLFLHGAPFNWADMVGWAKLQCGWINRLSVAFMVVGFIGMIPFFPFGDVAGAFALMGTAIFVLGILPQLMADGNP